MRQFITKQIKRKVSSRIGHILICILNMIFFSIWAGFQILLDFIISFLPSSIGTTLFVLAFQVIFGLSTLIPLCIDLYYDIKLMINGYEKPMNNEKKIGSNYKNISDE